MTHRHVVRVGGRSGGHRQAHGAIANRAGGGRQRAAAHQQFRADHGTDIGCAAADRAARVQLQDAAANSGAPGVTVAGRQNQRAAARLGQGTAAGQNGGVSGVRGTVHRQRDGCGRSGVVLQRDVIADAAGAGDQSAHAECVSRNRTVEHQGAAVHRQGAALKRILVGQIERAHTERRAAAEGVGTAKSQRAAAQLRQADGAAADHAADGQRIRAHRDLPARARRHRTRAKVQALRAGEGEVAVPVLRVVVGVRDRAAAAVVQRAAGNGQGARSQRGRVVHVQRAAAERRGAAVGVRAGESHRAAADADAASTEGVVARQNQCAGAVGRAAGEGVVVGEGQRAAARRRHTAAAADDAGKRKTVAISIHRRSRTRSDRHVVDDAQTRRA